MLRKGVTQQEVWWRLACFYGLNRIGSTLQKLTVHLNLRIATFLKNRCSASLLQEGPGAIFVAIVAVFALAYLIFSEAVLMHSRISPIFIHEYFLLHMRHGENVDIFLTKYVDSAKR